MNIANLSSGVAQALAAKPTQEATETLAQTTLEAAKGDRQAIQKLAKLQGQQSGQDKDHDGDRDSGVESPSVDTSVAFSTKA
jgi:hypothetical protein